jgi:hypothetical protein
MEKSFRDPAKLDCRKEERVRSIVDLSRRRDRILEAPMLDLLGLEVPIDDYEAANMTYSAAGLERFLFNYAPFLASDTCAERRSRCRTGAAGWWRCCNFHML